MVVFNIADLERVMKQPDKIRNLSVIAHVDHGKSTLTDSLFAGSGAIRMDQAGTRRVTDNRKDEADRCITIKSTGVTLLFPPSEYLPETLINLIDSPGHVDFSSEVTAALRATDGAFVVVDSVEGVCVQTETVLRQALQEGIQPVLIINKLDRLFLELQCEPEDIYQRLRTVIESVNAILSTYQPDGTLSICPLKGNVAFAAGLMGWAFTPQQIARQYAAKSNTDPQKFLKNLWGDRFVSKTRPGKWISKLDSPSQNQEWSRGFCEYLIKPIQSVFNACLKEASPQWSQLEKVTSSLGISMEANQTLTGKELAKLIMQTWIPAHLALLEIAVHHLPSPVQAQSYRLEHLYSGPLDDSTAQSIANCDPEGPLMIYISKMAPERPNDPSSRLFGFGRVFSGTIRTGQKVRILGPNYQPGEKVDLYENIPISRLSCMIPKQVSLSEVPAGNTVCVMGIDRFLSKNGTLCSDSNSLPFRNMIYSVAPVVQRAVEPQHARDLPKLVQAMKHLSASDNLVVCTIDEKTGQYLIGGAGELHLEICFNDLQAFMGDVKLKLSDPIVTYCETVIEESPSASLTKSPNNHNRLYGIASPLESNLVVDILKGDLPLHSGVDSKVTSRLQNDYGWDGYESKHVWSFSPAGGNQANALVNMIRGVDYVQEIKDSCTTALEWVSKEGVLAQEPMQGIRFSLTDAVLHADAIHRGGNQIIPAARNLFYAAQLSASPRLLEPIYLVEIFCPQHSRKGCYSSLMKCRGEIIEELPQERTNMMVLRAYIPVAESFGFADSLRAGTGGEAFPQMVFHHWKLVEGDPLQPGTLANRIVRQIRERKGLSPDLPTIEMFADKL